MSNTSHNMNVLSKAMGRKLGGSGNSEGIAKSIFTSVAHDMFSWLNSQTYYQNRTFNLSDSIGFGIYNNGLLVKWISNRGTSATTNKTYTYHGVKKTISGRKMLESAINYTCGALGFYSMKVFCAVPYGAWVELGLGNKPINGSAKAGIGWWSEGLIPKIKTRFVSECKKRKIQVKDFNYGES